MATAAREYPTYQELRARRLAALRARGLDALRKAEDRVTRAGGRLLVFGSFAVGNIHEHSDIDVALFGLPPEAESEVALDVWNILGDGGFESDVVLGSRAGPSLLERVKRDGRTVGALG